MATKDPEANREHQRAWRDRQRGGPPRDPKPHGTRAAVARHRRAGEQLCGECKAFDREYQAEMYRNRKARKEAEEATNP